MGRPSRNTLPTDTALRDHFEAETRFSVSRMAKHYAVGFVTMRDALIRSGLTSADLVRRSHALQLTDSSIPFTYCIEPTCHHITFCSIQEMLRVRIIKPEHFVLYASIAGRCPECHNTHVRATIPSTEWVYSSQLKMGDCGLTLPPENYPCEQF